MPLDETRTVAPTEPEARTTRDYRDAVRDRADRSRDGTDRERGNFTQYYEDLGTSATKAQYAAWKEYDDAYQAALASDTDLINQRQKEIKQYKKRYNKAVANTPGLTEAIDKAWNTHKSKNLLRVSVGSQDVGVSLMDAMMYEQNPSLYEQLMGPAPSNWAGKSAQEIMSSSISRDGILGEYYLPEDSFDELVADLKGMDGINYEVDYYGPNADKKELIIDPVYETGKLFHPTKSGAGNFMESLQNAHDAYYNKFVTKATQEIGAKLAENNEQLAKAKGVLDTAVGELGDARSRVETATQSRDSELERFRDQYAARLETIGALYGGGE